MPYPAALIACAFVKRGIEERAPVTQMKLQKLVYFAHGYHLAKYNMPLIEEVFEAWKFGPVVQSIYGEYRAFGNNPINVLPSRKLERDLQTLDQQAREAVDFTWKATKALSASVLSNWTHRPGSPWALVYTPESWSVPIGNDRIKQYFYDLIKKNGKTRSHQSSRMT